MENSWKAYFIFTKKELKGVFVLGSILFVSVVLGYFFPSQKMVQNTSTSFKQSLFYFDPNSIDSAHALLLGMGPRQVATLMHYRIKGGRFYKKQDLFKLYGLSKDIIEKLLPYVVINTQTRPNTFNQHYRYKIKIDTKNRAFTYDNTNNWKLDINTASEKQWIQLAKFNSSIAGNIIRYRNYLGGFTNLNQLKKVYGLTENEFFRIVPHLKIENINSVMPNANSMNFMKWKSLGLFSDREIFVILKTRKENGGRIGWRQLVHLLDLTENQVILLQKKVNIME